MYLDKPITDAENDFLNRNDCAIKLAKSISNWRNKESWVIALTGDWGSGKTSIKNLMVKELKKAGNPIHIIEFSPWEWANQELVTQSFFNELSKDLSIESDDKKTKEVAEKFKTYAYYLGESYNRSYRNEVLDCYLFNNLNEVRQLTDEWIEVHNHERPHDSLSDMTPAEYKQVA